MFSPLTAADVCTFATSVVETRSVLARVVVGACSEAVLVVSLDSREVESALDGRVSEAVEADDLAISEVGGEVCKALDVCLSSWRRTMERVEAAVESNTSSNASMQVRARMLAT